MLGWLFGRAPTKERLLNYKNVVIGGTKFVIRPVNVLSDFPPDKMPQIFTDTTRKSAPNLSDPSVVKRIKEDMIAFVQVGLVSPSKDDGITAADLFRDEELGLKLYYAIMEHSLFRFKGLKKCFFLVVKTLLRPIIWLKLTAKRLRALSLERRALA